jgi:hypothetical protein
VALLGGAVLLLAREASAQAVVAPSSHWGALMYPELAPATHVGVNFVAFTQFGKDVAGVHDPYNFQTQSVGFNLLSLSNTRGLFRDKAYWSNLLYRSTLVLGYSDDEPTEWFQNEVIHGPRGLAKIPREGVRTAFEGGYSGELNYQLLSLESRRDGVRYIPAPLFVGGGFAVGTVQQEAFAQLGIREFELLPILREWGLHRYAFLTFSAMARTGTAYGGPTFRHVASYYLLAQGSLALHLAQFSFPWVIELGMTGSSGVFLSKEKSTEAEPIPPSLIEQFWCLRVQIGDFTFETFNDQLGHKDKGPTYGVRIFYNLNPYSWIGRWL